MRPLIELLPAELNYTASPEMADIQNALSIEAAALWEARDSFAAQLCPATATWGLSAWEEAVGLTGDESMSLDTRRNLVISRLQGYAMVTAEMIETMARSVFGGAVRVDEYPAEYRIVIRSLETRGMPEGFDDLVLALKALVPAHISFELLTICNSHAELGALTHAEMATNTHYHWRYEVLDNGK